ncbi:hypothetical protein ACR71G_21655 [Xenorhabdus bovienii]|uniref:hypothetical protein n=1 Tax=Xenorhabdus bovienii TaxID=40576 RepID=UPI003DA4A83E
MNSNSSIQLPSSKMLTLDISISAEGVFDNIEMGVLQNGVPYLTQVGLAQLCGIQRRNIFDIAKEWASCHEHGVFTKGRMEFISSCLQRYGYREPDLYIPFVKNGTTHYAFPDVVCMAILEFYAFISEQSSRTIAQQRFRELAHKGLRDYIYSALHYQPEDPWKHYHNRVSIMQSSGTVPNGYFIVFNEIAGLMVDLIASGLAINMHTVPDISIGKVWANYWRDNEFDSIIGPRKYCEHYYPDEFNQSASNPQTISAYPNKALAEFRDWFKRIYLPTKFPNYILKKANLLPGGKVEAIRIADTFKQNLLR